MTASFSWEFDFLEMGRLPAGYGMTDFVNVAYTRRMLPYYEQYLRKLERPELRGRFYSESGRFSAMLIQVDKHEFVFVALQRKLEKDLRRPFTQTRYTRLEDEFLLLNSARGYSAFTSILSLHFDSESGNYSLKDYSEPQECESLPIEIKHVNSIQRGDIKSGSILWNYTGGNRIILISLVAHILDVLSTTAIVGLVEPI